MYTILVDAPWNDLQLNKLLLQYEVIDSAVLASAVKAMKPHLWYLTAEMVPLALNEEKSYNANCLLQLIEHQQSNPQSRFGAGFQKPAFFQNITLQTRLGDFIDNVSQYIFNYPTTSPVR